MSSSLPPLLPESFCARECEVVSRELLGKHLHKDGVLLRIVEVESYSGDDTASHGRFGRAKKSTEAMWGPPGRAYVFMCYGHQMLNVVTGRDGEASAVLIRACEPVQGMQIIRQRRKGFNGTGPGLLNGPGKVGAALGIDVKFCHHVMFEEGGLELRDGKPVGNLVCGPRIGIDFALKKDRDAPLRFADGDSKWVLQRAQLSVMGKAQAKPLFWEPATKKQKQTHEEKEEDTEKEVVENSKEEKENKEEVVEEESEREKRLIEKEKELNEFEMALKEREMELAEREKELAEFQKEMAAAKKELSGCQKEEEESESTEQQENTKPENKLEQEAS